MLLTQLLNCHAFFGRKENKQEMFLQNYCNTDVIECRYKTIKMDEEFCKELFSSKCHRTVDDMTAVEVISDEVVSTFNCTNGGKAPERNNNRCDIVREWKLIA